MDSNQYLNILQIIIMPLYYPNKKVRVLGIEPRTIGLKDHCSTNWAIQKNYKITLAGFEPALYNLEG